MKSSTPEPPKWAKAPTPDAVIKSFSDTDVVWVDAHDNLVGYQFIDGLVDARLGKTRLFPRIALGAGLTTLGVVATLVAQRLT
jgi:hypothetical protein